MSVSWCFLLNCCFIFICFCILVSARCCCSSCAFHYFTHRSGCEVLWWVCLSVCLCVCLLARISPEPCVQSLPSFLCVMPMSVAWSSSDTLTIGRIAYRQERVFFPNESALSAWKGEWEYTVRAKYAICDCLVVAVMLWLVLQYLILILAPLQ